MSIKFGLFQIHEELMSVNVVWVDHKWYPIFKIWGSTQCLSYESSSSKPQTRRNWHGCASSNLLVKKIENEILKKKKNCIRLITHSYKLNVPWCHSKYHYIILSWCIRISTRFATVMLTWKLLVDKGPIHSIPLFLNHALNFEAQFCLVFSRQLRMPTFYFYF